MTRAQQAAQAISDYLTTGMQHNTVDGQAAIAAIIDKAYLILDPTKVIYELSYSPYFDYEEAIAQLLNHTDLLVNGFFLPSQGKAAQCEIVTLSVLCNDVFAWGCADAEDLPYDQVESLYRAVIANPSYGATKWCCIRRNQKPQAPVVAHMKQDNAWDDVMEALPENGYDKLCRERFGST